MTFWIGNHTTGHLDVIGSIRYQVVGRIDGYSAIAVKYHLAGIVDINRSGIRTIADNNRTTAGNNHFIKSKIDMAVNLKFGELIHGIAIYQQRACRNDIKIQRLSIMNTGIGKSIIIQNHAAGHLNVINSTRNQIINWIDNDAIKIVKRHLTGIVDVYRSGIRPVADDYFTAPGNHRFVKIQFNAVVCF